MDTFQAEGLARDSWRVRVLQTEKNTASPGVLVWHMSVPCDSKKDRRLVIEVVEWWTTMLR